LTSRPLGRRRFLAVAGAATLAPRGSARAAGGPPPAAGASPGPRHEHTLVPFWFWNDRLEEAEILRQVADFEAHRVHGFVLHPRVGLPRDTGWMSPRLLGFMRVAIEEAARRGMTVFLYDEGMYPSGSSSGQVVAADSRFRCRGLDHRVLEGDAPPELDADHHLVAVVRRRDGRRVVVFDRPVDSVIRGLHYVEDDPARRPGPDDPSRPGSPREDPPEDSPPAADLLNPDAVACFIRLVYDRYHEAFGAHFGRTVAAIFTDEPMLLGRLREKTALVPGTAGILAHVSAHLGYDFTPYLPALFYEDEPEAPRRRSDWNRAVQARLETTYYEPLHRWCTAHDVSLTGHPARPDDLGHLRHFHIPGQDVVWRQVLPGTPSALEGAESTQAKCSSSAMIHLGRRRNANEFCGAFGHQLTFDEMKWLADWLLVRGVNLLIPHAFYYSVRGPRIDERPPDVGPHSPWWDGFGAFADYAASLCAMNAEGRHVCAVAVLGLADSLPWRAARALFEAQVDFNYLEARHLWEDAEVAGDGIRIRGMHYRALVLDGVEPPPRAAAAIATLERGRRLVRWPGDGLAAIERLAGRDVRLSPAHADVRYRHVLRDGAHDYLFFNEGGGEIHGDLQVAAAGPRQWLDPWHGTALPDADARRLKLAPHETRVLHVSPPTPARGGAPPGPG
jgi:hypothetical protein